MHNHRRVMNARAATCAMTFGALAPYNQWCGTVTAAGGSSSSALAIQLPPHVPVFARYCMQTAANDQFARTQLYMTDAVQFDPSAVGRLLSNLTNMESRYCSAWVDASLKYNSGVLSVAVYTSVTLPYVHVDVMVELATCSWAATQGRCSGQGSCILNMSNLGFDAGYCSCNPGFSGSLCEVAHPSACASQLEL
jgi:hypothetical protein